MAVVALVLAYFLPSLVAVARGHQSLLEIVTCNLLLGWTVLGWIVAFIWSLTAARWEATVVVGERFHSVHDADVPRRANER
jgi:hypothetical protein